MFRFLSYGVDLLAGLLLLMAPVIIVHWLLTILGIPGLEGIVDPISQAFAPLYETLDSAIPALPVSTFNGNTVRMTPLMVGIALIFTFFILSTFSMLLRKMEISLSTANSSLTYVKQRQQHAHQLQLEAQQAALTRNMVAVLVVFPFETLPPESSQLGVQPAMQHEGMRLYHFPQPEPALNFAQHAFIRLSALAQQYSGYDAAAKVQLTLHAVQAAQGLGTAQNRCQYLLRYCQGSQVLFSQQLYEVMAAQNIAQNFSHYSTGRYQFPNEPAQDIYLLDVKLPQQQTYF